jgi:hypothetical protein
MSPAHGSTLLASTSKAREPDAPHRLDSGIEAPPRCRPSSPRSRHAAKRGDVYSADRGGAHAESHFAGWAGLTQADTHPRFAWLYEAARKPTPIVEAACWAEARRKLFDLPQPQPSADRHRGG